MTLESAYHEFLNTVICISAAINFAMLAFFYKRKCPTSFSRLYSLAAFMIVGGQIYYVIKGLNGGLEGSFLIALSQIGLSIILIKTNGNVKKAGEVMTYHHPVKLKKVA